jgi:hypothetical protein
MNTSWQAIDYTKTQTHIHTLLEGLLAIQASAFAQNLTKKSGSNSGSMYRLS